MKYFTFVIIGGITALIAWMLVARPECADGRVVASETECLGQPGFDRRFCANAFSRPEEAIFRAGNVFDSLASCQQRFTQCIEYPGAHGYTPKPTGYCLVRGADGALASMTPVYGRR